MSGLLGYSIFIYIYMIIFLYIFVILDHFYIGDSGIFYFANSSTCITSQRKCIAIYFEIVLFAIQHKAVLWLSRW